MKSFFQSFFNNAALLLLSLGLGVIIWATAVREANPLETKEFALAISWSLPTNKILLNTPPTTVNVTIQAPRTLLEQVTQDDLMAVIDLAELNLGRNEGVAIEIQENEQKFSVAEWEQVNVVGQFPRTTAIELDAFVYRTVPIKLIMNGDVARTHQISAKMTEPLEVNLSGPATFVNSNAEARTDIFLNGERETIQRNRQLNFYDQQGNVTSLSNNGITASTQVALVTVQIAEQPGIASLPVVVNWQGKVADGYRFLGATAEPRTIFLRGDPDVIKSLSSVTTESFDISGLRQSVTERLRLILPDDVRIDDEQLPSVVVEVEVEPILTTQTYEVVPVLVGLSADLTATLTTTSTVVVLYGPQEALNAITPETIRVDVDLLAITEVGDYRLEPIVTVPIATVEVREVRPAQIGITVTTNED